MLSTGVAPNAAPTSLEGLLGQPAAPAAPAPAPAPLTAEQKAAADDAVAQAARDATLQAVCDAVARKAIPWNLGSALQLIDAIGPSLSEQRQLRRNKPLPESNGWPCTDHNGQLVSLEHVHDVGNGSFAWVKPSTID